MAKFLASQVVEPLGYDFNPYVDLVGDIPEPDDRKLAAFQRAMRAEMKKATQALGAEDQAENMTPQEFLSALEKVDQGEAEVIETNKRAAKIFSDLCSNAITVAQLMKVPPRVRIKFFIYLQMELLVPEAPSGGGNVVQLRPTSSATAG